VTETFLGFSLAEFRSWILLTGLGAAATFGVLRGIQEDAARCAWRRAGAALVAPLGLTAFAFWLRPASVTLYLGVALAYYVVILLLQILTA
jgi:hypothetical protein